MSFVNFSTREVNVKIVYHGADFAGKRTNMQYIYSKTNPEARASNPPFPIETEGPRALFFDFSPKSLGELPNGFRVRFHLYTLPGPIHYDTARPLILTGADGLVFVADSQRERTKANLELLNDLRNQLADRGNKDLAKIPLVLQYNKRDVPDAMPLEEMDQSLRIYPWERFDAIATKGIGVFETLKSIAKQILVKLKQEFPPTSTSK